MAEINLTSDILPQAVHVLGLVVPALACTVIKLSRPVIIKYLESRGLPTTEEKINQLISTTHFGHDHQVDYRGPKPKDNELVTLIGDFGGVDRVLVKRSEVNQKLFLREGEKIPGTNFTHNHKGNNRIDAWEF